MIALNDEFIYNNLYNSERLFRKAIFISMEIIRADHSGFCFGVQRAIDMTMEQIEKAPKENHKKLYSCGPLIHNQAVTGMLEKRGIGTIQDIREASAEDRVIVRSHGEPKEFYDVAEANHVELVDTTCVFVAKIHEIVQREYEAGANIIIVGNPDHQEVIATNGWCDYKAHILQSPADAETLMLAHPELVQDHRKSVVVCQTTFKVEILEGIMSVLRTHGLDAELYNTICSATKERQDACRKLAQEVELMIVIGDRHSSNSKKLFEIAKDNCKNSVLIQDISDLQLKPNEKYNKIGITAGASTPEWIIKEVIASMSENVTNNTEKNPMLDFMDDIENSLRLPRPGDVVEGKVHQVTEDEVIVNIGCKKDGILKKNEVSLEEGQTLLDLFKEGDTVQAKVMKTDDNDGGILLSKKKLEINENYKELNEAMENKETLSVKLIKKVNGGVIAVFKEVTGFVPMSQLADTFVTEENVDGFIGQTVDIKVLRVDNRRNRAVFSRKAVLVEEKRKQVAEVWANLNVGDIVEGKVMRFTDYGAFVDIGGVDGLLHISEISWGKLKNPQEVLNIGDIINVKILSLNEEKGKISLGLKQTTPEPWSQVGTKYQIGDVIDGKVVQIKEYGAFVELEAGLDGLVHISEIANKRVENVADELTLGQQIKAKIMDIDSDRKRISLSIKATLNDEEAEDAEEAQDEE